MHHFGLLGLGSGGKIIESKPLLTPEEIFTISSAKTNAGFFSFTLITPLLRPLAGSNGTCP